jgi:hypothetical protein
LAFVIQYLEENIGAAKVQLSQEEINAVRTLAVEAENLPGNRYGEAMMALVHAETPSL